jgi:hypothetical protein
MSHSVSIIAGFVGILMGLASWIGLLPRTRRRNYFAGGPHAELLIMGLGLMVLGMAGLYNLKLLGLVGLVIVVAGFVLGVVSPPWLVPRWYKELYPDPPVDNGGLG